MSPSFHIRYATESDSPALSHINVEAFAGSGFLSNTFPSASHESLEAFKAIIALKHMANPKMHVLGMIDLETSEMQGSCRWLIPAGIGWDRDAPPLSEEGASAIEDPTRFAPRPMNEAVYGAFKRLLEEMRKKHTTEDDFG